MKGNDREGEESRERERESQARAGACWGWGKPVRRDGTMENQRGVCGCGCMCSAMLGVLSLGQGKRGLAAAVEKGIYCFWGSGSGGWMRWRHGV